MKTKIYCDIADLNQIKIFNKKNIVKGFTTNPSLMRKAGAKNYENYSKKILKICKKPISFEVFGDDYESMKRQAFIINSWGKNIYVKIPIINSKGQAVGMVVSKLSGGQIDPELVNFAVKIQYIKNILDENEIDYTSIDKDNQFSTSEIYKLYEKSVLPVWINK